MTKKEGTIENWFDELCSDILRDLSPADDSIFVTRIRIEKQDAESLQDTERPIPVETKMLSWNENPISNEVALIELARNLVSQITCDCEHCAGLRQKAEKVIEIFLPFGKILKPTHH